MSTWPDWNPGNSSAGSRGRRAIAVCGAPGPAATRCQPRNACAVPNLPATSLRPAYALARITELTVSKIWSMWLRSQINGGENSNVSIAMRTIRPRS